MKKLLLVFAVLVLAASCSLEEDNLKFHVEFLPVDSVEIPESFRAGETYQIKVHYKRPNDCYYFDGFYYEAHGSVRVVAPQSLVIEHSDCVPLDTTEEASFDFLCSPSYTNPSYLFKFYKGTDAQGNQLFLEIEVPIVE